MASLEELFTQLGDALTDLEAALVDPVPAEEVFFVRDTQGFAHVAGYCLTFRPVPSWAKWETVAGSNVTDLTLSCSCVQRSPDSVKVDAERIRRVLESKLHLADAIWYPSYVVMFPLFPAVFEAWRPVNYLVTQVVISTPDLLERRAQERDVSVSQLPSVGVCTLQYNLPDGLNVFPNGVSAVVPWGMLPEAAADELWLYPDRYALVSVEGWPVERVEVASTLIRDAQSLAELVAAFKLAEQLVP